jgi:hypothetical protein
MATITAIPSTASSQMSSSCAPSMMDTSSTADVPSSNAFQLSSDFDFLSDQGNPNI